MLRILFLTSLTSVLIFSQPAFAQPIIDPPDGADETLPADYSVSLNNPLPTDSLPEFIGYTIRALLGIIGSLALAIFIYGGFIWMTAAGNAERIQKGQNVLTWAAIGLAVIFLSYPVIRSILLALAEIG